MILIDLSEICSHRGVAIFFSIVSSLCVWYNVECCPKKIAY